MNQLLRFFLCIGLFSLCHFSWGQGQVTIGTVTVNPNPPLECNNISVTVGGMLLCANYQFSSTSAVILGTNIQVNVFYTAGPICLPAIVPYSQTHVLGQGLIPAGNYTLTVSTFLNGAPQASSSSPLTIGSCCSVDPTFTANQFKVCEGDSIQFQANDLTLNTHIWTLDGVQVSTDSIFTYTFSTAGTYQLGLLGDDGTCADSSLRTIFVSAPLSSTGPNMDESCPGSMDGSISLTVSNGLAPYTYTWSNGSSVQNPSQLAGGTYTVMYSDSLGCSGMDTAILATGPTVVADFTHSTPLSSDTIICISTSVQFSQMSSGATQYTWLQNSQSFGTSPSESFLFLAAGNYLIELVASNGVCTDTSRQVFVVRPLPVLSATTIDESCPNSGDGAIDLTVTGGTGAYTYSWSTTDTIQDPTGLTAGGVTGGTFTVVVTDSLGCAGADTYTINAGSGPIVGFSFDTPALICEGTTVTLNNQTTNANQYVWTNNGAFVTTAVDTSVLFPTSGTYDIQLFATDGFCSDSLTQTLTVAAPPMTSGTLSSPTCPPNDMDGAIDLSITGGTGNMMVNWNTGASTEDLTQLGPGTYRVTVTDDAGCTVRDTFVLDFAGGLAADFGFFTGGNGVQFNDSSDLTATSWLWDFGDGNTSTLQNPLHFYNFFGGYEVCLIATDQLGCADTICQTISISTAIEDIAILAAKAYPNPTRSLVQVELPGIKGQEMWIRVIDATGRLVQQRQQKVLSQVELDMSGWSAGLYLLQIQTKQQLFQTQLMKQ